MMEVEQPWMESVSNYDLTGNMTFQVGIFFSGPNFGLRWENGVRVKKGGAEMLSKKFAKVIEL